MVVTGLKSSKQIEFRKYASLQGMIITLAIRILVPYQLLRLPQFWLPQRIGHILGCSQAETTVH